MLDLKSGFSNNMHEQCLAFQYDTSSIICFILILFPFSESHWVWRGEKKTEVCEKSTWVYTQPSSDHHSFWTLCYLTHLSAARIVQHQIIHLGEGWTRVSSTPFCKEAHYPPSSQITGLLFYWIFYLESKPVSSVINYKSWFLKTVFYMRDKYTLGMIILLLPFHHSVANSNNNRVRL